METISNIGKTINVLDHGEVTLVDVFGDDERIAEVARGSYRKGTKRVSTDEHLIRYLIRHQHSSPIEFGQLIFHLKMPIFVARQLVRHRTIKMNEMSLRYSEAPEEMFVPAPAFCGNQSTTNKQGRTAVDNLNEATITSIMINSANEEARSEYQELLGRGLSRELARTVLPVSQYTEMSISWDLRNLLGFLKLRLDSHAQYEIRVYAQAIRELAEPHFPVIFKAFDDYILNARTLSAMEQQLLAKTLNTGISATQTDATALGMSAREYKEYCDWLISWKVKE